MKKVKYPKLAAAIASKGENQQDIANILSLSVPTVNRRLSGEKEWTIGEIQKLCKHYKKDYYELFC